MSAARHQAVAIVGGSGFIGQAIGRQLAADGCAVTILDLQAPPESLDCHYLKFDMTQSAALDFAAEQFDAVIIAAGIMAKGCNEDPEFAKGVNVTATRALLEQLAAQSPQTRIVFLSSGMVYDGDNTQPPFTEDAPVAPACVYTESKLIIEQALHDGIDGWQPTALILRPFTVYGAEALSPDRGHLFGRWLDLGKRGEALTVYGDGSQVIDPVPVENIAAACAAWLGNEDAVGVTTINVSSGAPLTLRELADLFVETGLAPGVESLPQVAGDTRRGWGDSTSYNALTGVAESAGARVSVQKFLENVAATT